MQSHDKGDLAAYYFHQGTNYHACDYLGCHVVRDGEKPSVVFRTWAPNAQSVEVTGDFCGWDKGVPMKRVTEMGVWEAVYIPDDPDMPFDGLNYKFRVSSLNGTHLKADPYAFYAEGPGGSASKIWEKKPFGWTDSLWLARRMRLTKTALRSENADFYPAPMNIYELHLASWRTKDGKGTADGEHYLNYRQIADELAPYVKQMGYTHVELLPVMEHPFDGSWGYQVTGYYAPTSRFGTPDDFKYFVNTMHAMGIGVILDWVPAHFPKDEQGLYEFDGSPLYEYQGDDRKEHAVWGTRFFDVARNEVEAFLVSNAFWWIEEYHADGLRVDAVASMLYLDFDRLPGEWIPNPDGGNLNYEAIAFFKKLNSVLLGAHPDVLMIAEESTAFPMVTKPVADGGLGFSFKWNMGWANDTFEYLATDPFFRKWKHEKLTFPMMYSLNENYILPVSHDEVVHGKKSLLDKSFGSYEQKFAGTRLFFAYQMTHPGKKLTFMGCEYGPFREWDYENQLEWFMLDYDAHKTLRLYTAALNRFYLTHRALWEIDFSWEGFEWLLADDRDDNVIAYRRRGRKANHELAAVFNFSPVERRGFVLPGMKRALWREVFTSDDSAFGGNGVTNDGVLDAADGSLTLTLPGLSAVILEPVPAVGRRSGAES